MAYTVTANATGAAAFSTTGSFNEFTGAVFSGTDGSHSTQITANTTTPSAGSFTTTSNGDVVFGALDIFGSSGGFTWAASTGFTLSNNAASTNSLMDEFQIQTSAGAINPGFTGSGGTTIGLGICAGAAWKKSSGTASIVSSQKTNNSGSFPMVLTPLATPTGGDLLVCFVTYGTSGGVNATSRSVIDSSSNTWVEFFNSYNSANNFGASIFHVLSAAGGGGGGAKPVAGMAPFFMGRS